MPNIMTVAFGAVLAGGVTLAILGPPGSREPAPEPPMPKPEPSAAPVAAALPTPAPAPAPASTVPGVHAPQQTTAVRAQSPWVVPDVDKLPDDDWGRTVRRGRDLIEKTAQLIGPEAADPAHRFAGNNLNCSSCHLKAGTKKFGMPFQGVFADFPNYRARSGAVGTVEDRIEGCMTRSMNGKPLPLRGPEMTSIVAYMKFLSDGRPVGEATPGRGSGRMTELTRPADPERGQVVYSQNCVACHGANGQGQRVGEVGDGQGYTFPPLWGPDSFNDGAGMDRLIAAANFIHSNMPNSVTWDAPVLSVEDAWDVAAFVQAQARPAKANLDRDYPVALQRPADSGYGPYVDGFSQEQHRLGPFAPIRAKIKQMEPAPPSIPTAASK